ncbi:MAG: nucleotidyltransferase domain-containing protein [Defluviitaleaceae bacterium]|nr:nucleotidyltransferase domain-containing protein [Defluviitaleaceae bacterium]
MPLISAKTNEILSTVVTFYRDKYGENLEQVWLYGSKARGDYTHHSDMDIMIILDDAAQINKIPGANTERYELAMDILYKYNELIAPMEYTTMDFQSNQIPLHRNVKREGVLFYAK